MKKIYALVLASFISAVSFAGICTNLFFSEYLEGSGNNKALEIYNPTNAAINMNGYRVLLYTNGSSSPSVTFNLSGTLAIGDVYVIVNSQADTALRLLADTLSGVTAFTGNDAVVLMQGIDTLDVIGIIGNNPGIGWAVDTFHTGTADHTLIRMSNVNRGTTSWVSSTSQWNVLVQNANQLGAHTGPSGISRCSATAYDTLVTFSPIAGTFSGVNGTFNLGLVLNSGHSTSLSTSVELVSGNAAWINNFTTQSVSFSANTTQRNVTVTITNDTTGQLTHTLVFKITATSSKLKTGTDSFFTLTLLPFAEVDTCASLFFSEYVEGSANNKALEIYNPTNAPVNLNGYKILVFSNGSTNPGSGVFNLSGTLNVGDVYVIVNPQADSVNLKPLADTLSGAATSFNGNDAVALINGSDTIDVIGIIGNDPGNNNGWVVGSGKTYNHTLVRKAAVKSGTKSWPVSATQWDVYGIDTTQLGAHTGPVNITACVVYSGINKVGESNNILRVYPNPNNGKFVIELQNPATAEINLFDMTGQLVFATKETSSQLISVDANNLSAGMYLVEIKSGNSISRSRISVQY